MAAGTAVLAGCHGVQSALDPQGSGAGAIYPLWLIFLYVCAGVFAVVVAGLGAALLRRRGGAASSRPSTDQDTPAEHRLTALLNAATGITAAILVVLTLASYSVGSALFAATGDALDLEVIGHQWWWEVRYPGDTPGHQTASANEVHVPTGTGIRVTLRSDDVIHSLWMPNLHGKMDLVPGQTNRLVFAADRPGRWRGQCAEFCGLQHAFMALDVVASPPEEYRRWLAREARPAPEPNTDIEQRGRQLFAENCAVCHTIRGFRQDGKAGPDLTHLASRMSLGAGRLPNSRGGRGGWIVDAPTLKPGIHMPNFRLKSEDLQALLAYLDRLE